MTTIDGNEIRGHCRFEDRDFPRLSEHTPTCMGLPRGEEAADLERPAAPKRVRRQSVRCRSGYSQDFDSDVFEHLRVVDFGDADVPAQATFRPDPRSRVVYVIADLLAGLVHRRGLV